MKLYTVNERPYPNINFIFFNPSMGAIVGRENEAYLAKYKNGLNNGTYTQKVINLEQGSQTFKITFNSENDPILISDLEVGFGGFSTVYWGINLTNSVQHAIKIDNERDVEITAHEHSMNRALFPDSIYHPTDTLTVMPLLFGNDLCNHLHEEGPICDYNIQITIFNQLTAQLKTLHEQGYIHRDIKPENIMWDHEKGTLKIIDFAFTVKLDETGVFKSEANAGTFYYLSPELTKKTVFSKKSDIYAMGITFATLLLEQNMENILDTYEAHTQYFLRANHLYLHSVYNKKTPLTTDYIKAVVHKTFDRILNCSLDKTDIPHYILFRLVKMMCAINPIDRPNIDEVAEIIAFSEQAYALGLHNRHQDHSNSLSKLKAKLPSPVNSVSLLYHEIVNGYKPPQVEKEKATDVLRQSKTLLPAFNAISLKPEETCHEKGQQRKVCNSL